MRFLARLLMKKTLIKLPSLQLPRCGPNVCHNQTLAVANACFSSKDSDWSRHMEHMKLLKVDLLEFMLEISAIQLPSKVTKPLLALGFSARYSLAPSQPQTALNPRLGEECGVLNPRFKIGDTDF